jgi:hypothetical protein
MAVAALIKFVQGLNVGTAGVALIGELGTNVTASNAVDNDVTRWKWTCIDAPDDSAMSPGVLSDGAASTYTFAADARGGFHIELEVFPASGASKTHRLTFQVPELSGRLVPAFDAEATELNFSGTTRGWRKIMDAWLRHLDGQAGLVNATAGTINNAPSKDADGFAVGQIRLTGAAPVLNGIADGYEGRRIVVYADGDDAAIAHDAGGSTAANRITTGGGTVTIPQGTATMFEYSGSRWRMVAPTPAAPTGTGYAHVTSGVYDAAAVPDPPDTYVLYSNAGAIAGTPRLTRSASTGELTHSGVPNHSETRSEFHYDDDFGVAWSQWSSVQTTDGTTATAFPNAIDLTGLGDGEITVVVEISYRFRGGGGNFFKKATFYRTDGTLTFWAIKDLTDTSLQRGMIPLNVDVTKTDDDTIDVEVTGLDATDINWKVSAFVQMVYDPATSDLLYDFDFTTLDLGYMSDSAFLTRTGLTFTRSTTSTVQTSASTVVDGASVNYPVIGNLGSTLANRGLVIQTNTWNRLAGTATNGPRNLTSGSPWTAGTSVTITYPTGSPDQGNFGGCQCDLLSAGFCNYFDLGADDTTNALTFSTWQNGVGNTGTSDMQMGMNSAAGVYTVVVATQTPTWQRLKLSKVAATAIRFFNACDARDRSAAGGQTARVRHVGVDFFQVEYGPTATEAIPVTASARTKDVLSFTPGSAWIAANGQFKFCAKFCPKAASSAVVHWQTAAGTVGTQAAWFLWSWGANGQNYAKILDSDKKLYVKIANGAEYTSTNAISWSAGDQVEVYVAVGNNVASVVKYRINGGSWTDLVLATISDVPAPAAGAIRVFSDDNTATGDAGAMQCWLNRLTVYDTTAPAGV